MSCIRLLCLALLAATAMTARAAPIGTVTIVDGDAAIVREAQRFAVLQIRRGCVLQ